MKITRIPKKSILIIRTKAPLTDILTKDIQDKIGKALNDVPIWFLSEQTDVEILTADGLDGDS